MVDFSSPFALAYKIIVTNLLNFVTLKGPIKYPEKKVTATSTIRSANREKKSQRFWSQFMLNPTMRSHEYLMTQRKMEVTCKYVPKYNLLISSQEQVTL